MRLTRWEKLKRPWEGRHKWEYGELPKIVHQHAATGRTLTLKADLDIKHN